jgi:hypothetical protein
VQCQLVERHLLTYETEINLSLLDTITICITLFFSYRTTMCLSVLDTVKMVT